MRRSLAAIGGGVAVAATAFLSLAGVAAAQGGPAPVAPEPVRARTTAELAALCGAQPTADGRGAQALAYCHGFLAGAGEYHASLYSVRPQGAGGAAVGGRGKPLFCPPDPPPTLAAAGRSFAEWARAHPQHGNDRPVDGLARWASETYPCPDAAAPAARRSPGGGRS